MSEGIAVYISIMKDSLIEKCELLKKILELTSKQNEILCQPEVDADLFDKILVDKEKLIGRMRELDNGFEGLYQKISVSIKDQKEYFKPQILEMQNSIRLITDYSVKIQALESKNKKKFENFAALKRKEIRDFKVSNKTANSYYQNMTNQHHQWQSYFMDQKK